MANGFTDVMIDLETMGTAKTAAIVSIGAVEFDLCSGQYGRKFYEKVDLQSCLDLGLTVDGSTVTWWLGQPQAARAELIHQARPLAQVLFKLTHWLTACHAGYRVWGNGPSFDLVILGSAFQSVNQQTPWDFRNERCVRTLTGLFPLLRQSIPHRGIKHHAVADCLHQIELVSEAFRLATSTHDVNEVSA